MVRMGEDAWNIYSSHTFDFGDREESTDRWYPVRRYSDDPAAL